MVGLGHILDYLAPEPLPHVWGLSFLSGLMEDNLLLIIELKNASFLLSQFPWLLGRHVTRFGQSNVPTKDL